MTVQQLKNQKISELIATANLSDLTKECLSIIPTSTLKDNEIMLFINAGILDLERQGIDVANNIEDGLVKGAIVMFVKANFGMVDLNEKKLAHDTYISLCMNLSLSEEYKKKGDGKNV